MIRLPLRVALAAAGLATASDASAFAILQPSDTLIGIDLDVTSRSDYPDGEPPSALFDGASGTKYLNFGQRNSGIIVTPGTLGQIRSFRITTANDAPERDPDLWEIYGTNSPILSLDDSAGDAEPWTLLDSGAVALPTMRLTDGPVVPVNTSSSFSSYRIVFPSLRDDIAANSLQIGELGLFSSVDGSGPSLVGPADPVLAIHRPTSQSRYPLAEGPGTLVDNNPNTKYLNFGQENSGFIVAPSIGPTVISSFQVTTANDFAERDPTSWRLWGTNDPVTSAPNSDGSAENWTLIDEGTIALPATRFTAGPVVPVNNATQYAAYRLVFPTQVQSGGFPGDSMQYSGVQLFSDDPGQVRVTVNRSTGEVRIEANEAVQIASYSLTSNQFGALNEAAWNSVATTGDSNSGGTVDPNDIWEETSATDSLLSERDVPASGANDGFSLGVGQSRSLGNVWRTTPFEDLQLSIQDPTGAQVTRTLEFLGTPRVVGDYNGDGAVTAADWPLFRAGLGGDYSDRSVAVAYLGGDLDGDLDSDLFDFNQFVDLAGGPAALFGAVPEPASLTALLAAFVSTLVVRRRSAAYALAAVAVCHIGASGAAAQSFTVSGGAPTATTPDPTELPDTGPQNFFDDTFLDDPGAIQSELFLLDYNDPDLAGDFAQYQGLGAGPKSVFLDYGAPVSANWFAYSQRSGGDPTADRVGKFEFWFSNSPFNDVLPATPPDSVVSLAPTDDRLFDSVLRPYTLGGTRSGQYVAIRLTVSDASANRPTNNIGGHEFRLLNGPSDVVLEVNRSTGALTLRNNLVGAAPIDIKAYSIDSPGAGLNAASFNGLRGDQPAFPAGNGSGNGWEIGGGSGQTRLVESYFAGSSTLAAGTAGLALGTAYNPLGLSEDLTFTWVNSAGNAFDARVVYVGAAPNVLTGDYNSDGRVDAADYTVWRDANGTSTTLPNDATPGSVDRFDYTRWSDNYGKTAAAVAAAVPEPTAGAVALLTLISTGVGVQGRRRA